MQSIELQCPACGAQSELDAGFSGGVCRCAACGEIIEVPEARRTFWPRGRRRADRPEAPSPSNGARLTPRKPAQGKPGQTDTENDRFEQPSSSALPGQSPVTPRLENLRLTVVNGPDSGSRVEISPGMGCRIGRQTERRSGVRPHQMGLDDEAASRHHAIILWRGDSWALADVGSRNGTFINQQRVLAPTDLRHGDTIRIGHTVLTVEVPVATPQTSR